LLNVVLDWWILPNTWTIGVIRPIYKKRGSPVDPDNNRAIIIVQ
jgi:hypothetical protein